MYRLHLQISLDCLNSDGIQAGQEITKWDYFTECYKICKPKSSLCCNVLGRMFHAYFCFQCSIWEPDIVQIPERIPKISAWKFNLTQIPVIITFCCREVDLGKLWLGWKCNIVISFSLKGTEETCKYSAELERMGAGKCIQSCIHTFSTKTEQHRHGFKSPSTCGLAGALSSKKSSWCNHSS